MTDPQNPFRHHPSLKGLITPLEESFFGDFTVEQVVEDMKERGQDTSWITPREEREACRHATLDGRWDSDLWVFAYGSLIWDPALRFSEVRRGFAPGVERKFCLYDDRGARGSAEAPGVMAGLDEGAGCHGVVFRIDRDRLDAETYRLWSRERIGPAYIPRFIPVETAEGDVEAVTFMVNHAAENIRLDLSHEDQVRLCALGVGELGSSYDYVANLARHFEELKIEDAKVTRLLTDATAYRDAMSA
ncbi:gamma-glutamylcyclotransferase [Mesobacterium sp. TK19101]|uniref:glutathione-specific gamma-glutamylcyclotransferase n=1 Tax=Mesobacterium hydrothermale TaxID=3111907 RepID=A0ABU6HBM6_9RHOB|nr:gamma-glutamylcyclotransferase [Mesobacterium sp. TK19101]MEC3859864.1 gamma-glutamylcyclotransferase [Mesobacterium sp. TK19101]